MQNRRICLVSRPEGAPVPENFRLEACDMPQPADGQVLLRTLYLSLDPYMRGRISDAKSYAKPVGIGETMVGGTVCEVIDSRHADFKPGDTVLAAAGWQMFSVADASTLTKLDPSIAPVTAALGVLGMPGMTAYTGLHIIGQPKPGETVVVAAASGPVGSAVGQIARIRGCRAVGIVGGAEKQRYIRDELGFDAAIDHRAADFHDQLRAACPNGIDIYFENVGGEVWKAVFPLLNDFARIPVCGLIAQYNATGISTDPVAGMDRLPGLMRTVLTKRLTIRGFIVSDFAAHRGDFLRDVPVWIRERKLRWKEDVINGLENAPAALIGLLQGKNFGKLLVRVHS